MSKTKSIYICQSCGAQYSKWQGKCDDCGEWNSISIENMTVSPFIKKSHDAVPAKIFDLKAEVTTQERDKFNMPELDRVLGGGLVTGSVTLLGGDPGIGKSTILLQAVQKLAEQDKPCLYISGEESLEQIQLRAHRLQTIHPNIKIATSTLLKEILKTISNLQGYGLIIIDSIQTLYHDEINASPGTVSQVRACAFELIRAAKQNNISIILVGHVTKEGQIAGPKVLEHMVDTVLYFEGDHNNEFRVIRAVKNRFGAANEIGIFEMTQDGLQEVPNPSSIFLPLRDENISGSAIFAGLEGSRPILLEIQALIVPSFLATPRRAVVGWDQNRLAMMIAILNARFGLNLLDKEVYLNVTGGLKVTEPGADLAVAAALISAASNLPLKNKSIFIGEVGLSGELRLASQMEMRLNEAFKLGFETAFIPFSSKNFACNIVQNSLSHIVDLKKIIFA